MRQKAKKKQIKKLNPYSATLWKKCIWNVLKRSTVRLKPPKAFDAALEVFLQKTIY